MPKGKAKETISKEARVTYIGNPIRLSADFSLATSQAKREWQDISQALKDRNLQPRIICPVSLSRIKGDKEFPGQAMVHHH